MGQILHGSATMTAAVRRAVQHSQESLRTLTQRYGVNPKMVAKWKRRSDTSDCRTGPKAPSSTVLSTEEEAISWHSAVILCCLWTIAFIRYRRRSHT